MGRMIDTDAAYTVLTDYYHHSTDTQHQALKEALGRVESVESVEVVPVVRCAVCRHFQCNMRGDGTLPNGVDEFECRNGRGGCDPMDFCDEGERKDGDHEKAD